MELHGLLESVRFSPPQVLIVLDESGFDRVTSHELVWFMPDEERPKDRSGQSRTRMADHY
jgi:hypothetical protein